MMNVVQFMMTIASSTTGKRCRYFFDFNGDGYIETARRWNPDAVNPSFEWNGYIDTSELGTFYSQTSASATELRFFVFNSDVLGTRIAGNIYDFTITGIAGLGLWSIKYDGIDLILFKNGVEIQRRSASIGSERDILTKTYIGVNNTSSYYNGISADNRFWIDGSKDNGMLVLNMPINDNSNTIKDYSQNAQDGILTAGSGSWVELCEGAELFNNGILQANGVLQDDTILGEP